MSGSTKKSITIIGCGPAGIEYCIPFAVDHIKKSDVVIGSRRLLSEYQELCENKELIEIDADVLSLLAKMEIIISHNRSIAVLVTGDPGIASIALSIINFFGKEICQCIPGISSVQLACARLCLDWTNALIINAHKEVPSIPVHNLQLNSLVIMLCGNKLSWPWILSAAEKLHFTHNGFRCENLGMKNEKISLLTLNNITTLSPGGGNSVLIWKKKEAD